MSALIWLCAVLCLVTGHAFAATRAWLDRERISLGETATLNIETDQADADIPDYSPLRSDFRLSGHTSSRQMEVVNGVSHMRTLFGVALEPKQAGRFDLPPLRVGAERTTPLHLDVGPSAVAPRSAGSVVFIESEADTAAPYVQQAVGFTVRLYYATSLISGQLDQDPADGAALQRVGDDLQYQRELGGKRYTVVERRYLLVPERSGAITIPGARFRGQGVGGFFDDLFGDGRRDLAANAAPRTLQVRPVPANAPQPWLPLRGLSLQYLDAAKSGRAGEAATITVEARVDGASATQVPELRLGNVQGAQVFADPPQIAEAFDQGRPQVRVVRKFAVVPAQPGMLRVPGPRLEWWDVRAGAPRTASLPDIALQVAPGAAGIAATPATATANATQTPAQRWVHVPFVQGAVHPWALATVVFALLWLATLWWGLHRKSGLHAPGANQRTAAAPTPDASAQQRRRGLKEALASGDLAAIGDALCAAASPQAGDLDAVCARLDEARQVAAVRALQQARWGSGDDAGALALLRDAFRAGPAWAKPSKQGDALLPPLYPRPER